MAPPVGVGLCCSLQAHSGRCPQPPQLLQTRATWGGWGLRSMDAAPHSLLCPHSCLCFMFHPPGLGIPWDTSLPVFLGLEPLGRRVLPHGCP